MWTGDQKQVFDLVSLAGSARWCRKGVLSDERRLRELKEEIGL